MIVAIMEFLLYILAGGIFWGILRPKIIEHIESQVALYPTYFNAQVISTLKSIINWFLFISLIGSMIGLWIYTHRTKPEGVYYG